MCKSCQWSADTITASSKPPRGLTSARKLHPGNFMAWTSVNEQLLVRCNVQVIKYLYFLNQTLGYIYSCTLGSPTSLLGFHSLLCSVERHVDTIALYCFLSFWPFQLFFVSFFLYYFNQNSNFKMGDFGRRGVFFKDQLPPKRLNLQNNVLLNHTSPHIFF